MALIEPSALDLRTIDADALAAARSLAGLLHGHRFGEASLLSAQVECRPECGDCWLSARDARIAIRVAGGEAAILHPERVERIVSVIDRLETVFDAVEARSGLLLEFDACSEGSADDVLPAVDVQVTDETGKVSAAFHLVPRKDWRAPSGLIPNQTDSGAAALPISRIVRGPRLSIDEASGIARGDILLLAEGGWIVQAAGPPLGPWSGLFDPANGVMVIGQPSSGASGLERNRTLNTSPHNPDSNETGGQNGIASFAVPVSIVLPDTSATVGELASLAPGATLMLGPVAAGMEVELRVADRPIASGELVRLGDNYAVLVTAVPAAAPPVQD